MLLAFALDLVAVTWGGVSSFCLSSAYLFLVPAHAALWGAGRWFGRSKALSWSSLPSLGAAVALSTVVAEVLSSGGFYLFSGRFTELSVAELGSRLLTYFPSSLEAMVLYVGMGILVHALLLAVPLGSPRGGPARG
jgi:hypothetical protein